MVVYKLKHIPTGLYFTPSRGSGNLSKNGKIYKNKPSLDWVKTIRIIFSCRNSMQITNEMLRKYFNIQNNKGDVYVKTNPEDWEIIEL